jgi:hypothetical protein
VGDVKGGQTYADGFLEEAFEEIQKFQEPVIFTPGDNEWADCHGAGLGSFLPSERLQRLREIFFPQPGATIGGRAMGVTTQALQPGYERYVENVRWIRDGVTFATIHLVGNNNGLNPWLGIDSDDSMGSPRPDRIAECEERQAAGLSWLDETFAEATSLDSPGVFIAIHANPRFEIAADDTARAGCNAFLEALRTRTLEFGRPVVLAHGDTHYARVDKPLTAQTANATRRVENFTRVETFGFSDTHWIRVTVDPQDREVFRFELMTVEENRREFVP